MRLLMIIAGTALVVWIAVTYVLRHFTGNASHQSCLPLAIVRTQLALAQRGQDRQTMLDAVMQADQAGGDAGRILAQ